VWVPIGVGANLMCTSKMAYKKYISTMHIKQMNKQNRTYVARNIFLYHVYLYIKYFCKES